MRSTMTLLLLFAFMGLAQAAERVRIPAGPFQMGCSVQDPDCEEDEGPAGGVKVHVPAFSIDRHEVTVADYRRCMEAGLCTRPKDFQRNKYCNLGAPDRAEYPVNCVDWSQAVDYCTYAGGRLPYEAEWEKAARGGTTSRHPWGQEVSCENAILDDGVTLGSVPNEPDGCGEDRSWPVASRAPNPFGLYDMHGNVGEWTANWYTPDALTRYYAKGELGAPNEGLRRVVRGGSWDENGPNLRSSFRNVKPPVSDQAVYGSIGLRCAEDDRGQVLQ